jgi:hypothetical protein
MSRPHGFTSEQFSNRRVNGNEYSRLLGGNGIRLPDRIRPVKVGTVTNKFFKI